MDAWLESDFCPFIHFKTSIEIFEPSIKVLGSSEARKIYQDNYY